MGDDVRLEVQVGGGAAPFTSLEFIDLANNAWNVSSAILPWLGLRRITDVLPAAAGSSSVVLRFEMNADQPGERTLVDNFVVRCADLVAPTVSAVTDAGAGMYTFTVASAARAQVDVTCSWQTTNDGPVIGRDVIQISP